MDILSVIGVLIGIVLAAVSLAIPIFLRTYWPHRYTGIWRALGELMPLSVARIGYLVLGSLLGLGFIMLLQIKAPHLWALLIQPPWGILANLGIILILGLATAAGIQKWINRKRP